MFFSIYFQEAADPLTVLPGYACRARGAGKGATIQAQRVQAHLGQSAVLGYKLSEKFMEEMGGGNFMQICSFKRGEGWKTGSKQLVFLQIGGLQRKPKSSKVLTS